MITVTITGYDNQLFPKHNCYFLIFVTVINNCYDNC